MSVSHRRDMAVESQLTVSSRAVLTPKSAAACLKDYKILGFSDSSSLCYLLARI